MGIEDVEEGFEVAVEEVELVLREGVVVGVLGEEM